MPIGFAARSASSPVPIEPIFLIDPTPPSVSDGVNSSTSWLVCEFGSISPDSSRPLTIGICPSGRRTPVGYQRPWAIARLLASRSRSRG